MALFPVTEDPVLPEEWSTADERVERKFVVPTRLGPAVALGLRAACRLDPRFPESRVHTIYFDSPRLRSYEEKKSGDFRKLKFRLRWYEPWTGGGSLPAWLEIKARVGQRSSKRRHLVFLPARPGAGTWVQLAARAAEGRLPGSLRPACWLSYDRLRLVGPDGTRRVAVDRDIRLEHAAVWLSRLVTGRVLPFQIVEVKGPGAAWDPLLARVVRRHARETPVSKYAMCLDHAREGLR